MSFTIQIIDSPDLPPTLESLADESEASGFRFVRKLIDEWASGKNRFARPGERLFVAQSMGGVIGVCGLNIDPYENDDAIGRVRHLYVSKDHRRLGVGRALIEQVILAASQRFSKLHLRTLDTDAAKFYEALGFAQLIDHPNSTHAMLIKRSGG